MARKKKSKEDLQNENEFLKMSLMAEFGGEFVDAGGENPLPAEVENMFLKHIQKFHRMQNTAPVQMIYDLLGKPEYDNVHDLSDQKIYEKIIEFQDALLKKQIVVTTLSHVDAREFYRFIVEDVFKIEAIEMHTKHFTMNIIYEDYYPSEEADVKIAVYSACNLIFTYGMAAFPYMFAEDLKNKIGLSIDIDDLMDAVEKFQTQFSQIEISDSAVSNMAINGDFATATAFVEYRTQAEKGKRFKTQETGLEFQLEKMEGNRWFVTQVVCSELDV